MKPQPRNPILLSIFATIIVESSAPAASVWWDGGSSNWTTLTAWTTSSSAATPDPTTVPGASDDLTFNRTGNNAAASTVSFAGGNRAARSLTFATSGTTLFRAGASGNTTTRTLTIGTGGITVNSGAGAVTIGDTPGTYGAIEVVLGASQVWTNNGSNTLTVNGAVGGTGFQLTKSGSGQVRLNGANTYTGATIVDAGNLTIGNYAGLDNTSSITVSGGTAGLQLAQVGTGTTSNSINKDLGLHGFLRTVGGSSSNLLNLTWDGNITLAGASTITNNGNSTIDVNGQVDLGAHTLTFQTDRAGSRIDGNIVGDGGSFTKTGNQNLTLTGTNTYTGTTTIASGTLSTPLAANLAGYASSGKVIVDGGRLDLTMGDGSATGWSTDQVDALLANATKTSGNLGINTVNGDLTQWTAFDSATNFGGLGLTKLGANTLTLDQANTHAATAIVNGGGTLKVTQASALGAGPVTISTAGTNSGTLELALSGTNSIANTFNGFSSANGLTNATAGSAQIRNTSGTNTITSDLTITGTGGSGLNVASDGGLLTLAGTITHTVTAGPRTLSLGGSGEGVVSGAINNFDNSGTPINLAVNKSGSGTWTLSNAASNYAGTTTVAGGTLKLGADHVIPDASAVTIGGAGTAGTLDLAGFSETFGNGAATTMLTLGSSATTVGGLTNQVVNSGGAAVLAIDGGIQYNAGTTDFNNGKALISANIEVGTTASRNITVADSAATDVDLEITGIVSGSQSITKAGSGTLFLNNSANTFSGQFLVDAGTVRLTKLDLVGNSSSLGAASPGDIRLGNNATATLDYVGADDSTTDRRILIGTNSDTNTGSATILNNSATGKLTFSNPTFNTAATATVGRTLGLGGSNTMANTIGGAINDNDTTNGGAVSLVKQDEGTWILGGANTYTGTTTINGGTLALGASGSIASSSAIIVGANTTFDVSAVSGGFSLAAAQTLSGSGSLVGAMNVSGTLSPGNSPGILATGSQAWLDGGSYNWQIHDATGAAGTGFDQIQVAGILDLGALSANGFNLNLWSLSAVGPDVGGDALGFDNSLDQSWVILTSSLGISGFDAANVKVNVSAFNGTDGFSNALHPSGSFTLTADANRMILNYNVIPEPDVPLLMGCLGGVLLLRRRR